MINLKENIDLLEVRILIAECMWPDDVSISKEINLYKTDDSRELFGRFINNELVGLIGIIHKSIDEVELKHIAIRSDYRKQGIGRVMIFEYIEDKGIRKMIAETDINAVNFYKKIGFQITSLGEKYPGFERFQCIFQ